MNKTIKFVLVDTCENEIIGIFDTEEHASLYAHKVATNYLEEDHEDFLSVYSDYVCEAVRYYPDREVKDSE